MEKIEINMTVNDLKNILNSKKEELELITKQKYKTHAYNIMKYIYGGLYKGFFNMNTNELKMHYHTAHVIDILDFNVLSAFINAYDKVIRYIKNSSIDISENNYGLSIYDNANHIGYDENKKFIEQFHCRPSIYLDSVVLKKTRKPKKEKMLFINVNASDDMYKKIYDEVKSLFDRNLSMEELDEIYSDLRKKIQMNMLSKYNNKAGFGSSTNKIYLGFYGMDADGITTRLKQYSTFQKSVYRSQDYTNKVYYLTCLKAYLDELLNPLNTSENVMRLKGLSIGVTAKNIYKSEYNMLPIDNLVSKNVVDKKQHIDDFEQLSLYTSHNVTRVRKQSMSEYYYDTIYGED